MGVEKVRTNNLRAILENIMQQHLLLLNEYQIETDELSILLGLEMEKTKIKKKDEDDYEAMIATLKEQISDKKSAKDKFLVDNEQLKKEIAAMQRDIDIEQKVIEPSPVGVPIESNHIAFVIDTSGSMRDGNTDLIWSYVVQKFYETLESYPEVKGIQLLDADGFFILGRGRSGRWMEDSKEARAHMVRAVRLYPRNSNSNPVPGVVQAIRTLADPDNEEMKMGIYILGDEFTGKSEPVLKTIKNMNYSKDGKLKARINAIGFPNLIRTTLSLGQSGLKFANLMRELTYQNGGAFIALEKEPLEQIKKENRRNNPPPAPRPPIMSPRGIIIGRPY